MNSFKNLKIGKKLILSFLTILILTSSLSIYILGKLSYTANLTDYMYDGPYKLVNESLGIRMEIINISRCLNSGFVDNNHTGENKTIAESFNKIEENIKSISANELIASSIGDHLKNLENAIENYKSAYENLYARTQVEGFTNNVNDIDGKENSEEKDLLASKGSNKGILITSGIILTLVIAGGVAGYYFYKKRNKLS